MKHTPTILWLWLCICCASATAQTPVARAHLFGLGGVRQLDTYLSPLEYRGPKFLYLNETERPLTFMGDRVQFQSSLQLDFSLSKPASDKAKYMGAGIGYAATFHYRFLGTPPGTLPTDRRSRFTLMAGPQLAANLGGLYNTRNGNNPAQAYLGAHLAASVVAGYTFRIRRMPLTLRDQLDVPLLGAMFTPAYGQSYYEIFSLEHSDHNIRTTHPFNAPSLTNRFTIDLPMLRATMRLTYLVDVRQSDVNSLRRHAYTHAFMIGWVRNIKLVPPQRYATAR